MDHVRLGKRLRERADFAVWLDEEDHEKHLKAKGCDMGALEASGPFRKNVREQVGDELLLNDYSTPHAAAWPFALFVNLWAPHPPFYVPRAIIDLFPPDQIELPPNVGQVAKGEPANRREGVAAQLAQGVDEAEWRRAWSAHLALTHLVDDLVGRLLASLDQHGVAEDTLVVFTSDHGDHLGQHAMYRKMELYDQASRVPLIVRGPDVNANQQIDTLVSHLDLMPTVLDAIRNNVPTNLDGRSLASALRGTETLTTVPVFTQFTGNNGPSVARHAVMYREHKLILDADDVPELYDLKNDPLEMQNRAGDPASAAIESELTTILRARLAEKATN